MILLLSQEEYDGGNLISGSDMSVSGQFLTMKKAEPRTPLLLMINQNIVAFIKGEGLD